ncbi:MAG: hypothetical protein OXH98_20035 [Caldilineaceae bacterium]|nr:hypothetical protein [Caldilineaceae bacterium]
MIRKFLSLALVVFVTACVPITPEPAAPEPAAATEDCYSEGVVDGYALQPGQSAIDPPDEDVPSYVDIVKVESALEGETLSAVFYLRELPEELEFNRKGIHHSVVRHEDADSEAQFSIEYLWHVHIDADGDSDGSTGFSFLKSEYTLMAYYFSDKDSEPAVRPVRDAIQIMLFEKDPDNPTYASEVGRVKSSLSLSFSHEEDTITLTGEVPGISAESYLQFETMDFLMTTNVVDIADSFDKISCRPTAGHP